MGKVTESRSLSSNNTLIKIKLIRNYKHLALESFPFITVISYCYFTILMKYKIIVSSEVPLSDTNDIN